MDKKSIADSYMSIMKQMEIDYENELSLIDKLKLKYKNQEFFVDKIIEGLNAERESFFTKYSWTVTPYFFHISDMRTDYIRKSAERCKIIYDKIYNSND